MFAKFGIGLLLLIMGLMTLGSSLGVAEMTWLLVDPRAPAELRGNIPQPALAVIASVTLLLNLARVPRLRLPTNAGVASPP